MFIKPFFKHNKTTGERCTVFKLCESYRLNWGISHRIIISFGRLEELETVEQKKLLATSLVNIKDETISIRQCTEPTKEVKKVYGFLKCKYAPFVRKKSVVPPAEILKSNSS